MQSAWNSAAGYLTAAIWCDPQLAGLAFGAGLPATWTARAEALRGLPGDHGRFTLTRLAEHISWLYSIDPAWTEGIVVAPLDREGDDRDAILAGFFGNPRIEGEALFCRLKPAFVAMAVAETRPRERRESVLADLFITAWRAKTDVGARYCSDDELRTVIVHGSNTVRTRMLWRVREWEIGDKLPLLRDVWPLQLAVRSVSVSARLCEVAFGDETNFAVLADAILPVLSPIAGHDPLFISPPDKQARIFACFPRKVLEVLWKILPEQPQGWPFIARDMLAELLKADPKLAKDAKFAELRRRQTRSQ